MTTVELWQQERETRLVLSEEYRDLVGRSIVEARAAIKKADAALAASEWCRSSRSSDQPMARPEAEGKG